MEKGPGEDQDEDGVMTSTNGKELRGQEQQKTESYGEIWRRATSCSGGTQPRYKVQYIRTYISSSLFVLRDVSP